jgi:hypothetical protein
MLMIHRWKLLPTSAIRSARRSGVLVAAAALAITLFMGAAAQAGVVELVKMTFASGAVFSGDVTFTNGFSNVAAVNGTLTDYHYGLSFSSGGYFGFSGSGSEAIDWVQGGGSQGSDNYGFYLADGSSSHYWNTILFAYNDSGPVLTLAPAGSYQGYNNYIDQDDPMVSGSITPVPELATWGMMLIGFGMVGFKLRRRRARFLA